MARFIAFFGGVAGAYFGVRACMLLWPTETVVALWCAMMGVLAFVRGMAEAFGEDQ